MTKSAKQQYWFKRRRYGYGWTPTTWQGWLAVSAFLFVAIGSAVTLIAVYEGVYDSELIWVYMNIVFVALAGFIIVSTKKAPVPKWRWGKKTHDNPHEDH